MTVPKKKVEVPYSLIAAKFGGEVAETCIPQIRPVVEALPPEDVYAFWCGLMIAFAAFADATIPPNAGKTSKEIVQKVLDTLPDRRSPSLRKLN